MAARRAFAPLASLLTSLDGSVQTRAEALYDAARARTAKGSGNELPDVIMGNSTGYAAACLLIAQIEINGPSSAELKDYQRHSSLSPAHFKTLYSKLALLLGTGGSGATTPSRGSARKRRHSVSLEEAGDGEDDPSLTTPTKSGRRTPSRGSKIPPTTPSSASKAASASTSTSTSAPAASTARTTPRSKRVQELIDPSSASSLSKENRQRMEDDIDEGTDSALSARVASSPRRSGRVAPAPSGSSPLKTTAADTGRGKSPSRRATGAAVTPTKNTTGTGRRKVADTAAFERSMQAASPTKSAAKPASSARKSAPKSAMIPALPAEAELEQEEEVDEEQAVPYEPYWDDMLIRWRDEAYVKRMLDDTERWKMGLLQKLQGIEAQS